MPIQTAHTLPPMTACIVQYHNSGLSGQSALTPQEIINDNDHLKIVYFKSIFSNFLNQLTIMGILLTYLKFMPLSKVSKILNEHYH